MVIGAQRNEFEGLDRAAPSWTIPGGFSGRSKSGHAHVVPLSRATVAIIQRRFSLVAGQAIFPVSRRGEVTKGNPDASRAALSAVASNASDEGYKAIAKLRLAGLLLEKKAYDEALQQVSGSFPKDFAALADDRRGDILLAQGKKNEAKAEYQKAYKGLAERFDYRRLVEVKLNALGVDPSEGKVPPAITAPNAGDKP